MQKIEPSRKCLTRFLLDRLMFNIFKTTSCNSISVSSVVTVCTCDGDCWQERRNGSLLSKALELSAHDCGNELVLGGLNSPNER